MTGGEIEPGTCSACGQAAERGPSGAWWHIGRPCGPTGGDDLPARPAVFQRQESQQEGEEPQPDQGERQQPGSPRDRMIRRPGRNR